MSNMVSTQMYTYEIALVPRLVTNKKQTTNLCL